MTTTSALITGLVMQCFLIGLFSSGAAGQTVFVCKGRYAPAFHCSRACEGLRACRDDIVRVSAAQARALGRAQCSLCRRICESDKRAEPDTCGKQNDRASIPPSPHPTRPR